MTKPLASPTDDRHLFIVRFWHEESEAEPAGQWRGTVEHVPSGQRCHFVSLEVLDSFISKHINSATTDTADQSSS